MAINLSAVFLLSRALGPKMPDPGHGKIIDIVVLLPFQGGILVSGYAAAKGAVAQLTHALGQLMGLVRRQRERCSAEVRCHRQHHCSSARFRPARRTYAASRCYFGVRTRDLPC